MLKNSKDLLLARIMPRAHGTDGFALASPTAAGAATPSYR